jgi:hypothetical protein
MTTADILQELLDGEGADDGLLLELALALEEREDPRAHVVRFAGVRFRYGSTGRVMLDVPGYGPADWGHLAEPRYRQAVQTDYLRSAAAARP